MIWSPRRSPRSGTPTPIWISRRTRTRLMLAGLALVVLILYLAPTILVLALGGAALALALSFPVDALARGMPRPAAIAISLLVVLGLIVLLMAFVVPVLIEQLGGLVQAIPGIADRLGERLSSVLRRLAASGLLPAPPDQFFDQMQQRALTAVEGFATGLLGSLGQILASLVGLAIALFGIVFIAVWLLSDSRRLQATLLRASPPRYRGDVRALWDAFSLSLSRYLGGLLLSLAIQGVLSAVALAVLGVPYALLLGAWVSVTALIPYLGAFIGGAPAVALALTISPTTALLTLALFVLIQQLEGNVLTPRIQGQAVRVHPALVFLAVIAGGELFGVMGILFAVPIVAVLRVLFDFFRARLRVKAEPRPVELVNDRAARP